MDIKTLTSTLVLTFLMTAPAAMAMNEEQDQVGQVGTPKKVTSSIEPTTPKPPSKGVLYYLSFGYYGGSNEQPLPNTSPASSLQIEELAPKTFRTTGENILASNKHSAIRIELSNQELQSDAYQLIITYRTKAEGTLVRISANQSYIPLGPLPVSVEFSDISFDLSGWAKTVRHDSPLDSGLSTYLSFTNGKSDIHSFKIHSGKEILKKVVLGDQASESQPGVHVYAPETDKNANEWSEAKHDDVKQ